MGQRLLMEVQREEPLNAYMYIVIEALSEHEAWISLLNMIEKLFVKKFSHAWKYLIFHHFPDFETLCLPFDAAPDGNWL